MVMKYLFFVVLSGIASCELHARQSTSISDALLDVAEHFRLFTRAATDLPKTSDDTPKIEAILAESDLLKSMIKATSDTIPSTQKVNEEERLDFIVAAGTLQATVEKHVDTLENISSYAIEFGFEDYVYGSITRHRYLAKNLTEALSSKIPKSQNLTGLDIWDVVHRPLDGIYKVYYPLKYACKEDCIQGAGPRRNSTRVTATTPVSTKGNEDVDARKYELVLHRVSVQRSG